jgi:DNA polymerase eta
LTKDDPVVCRQWNSLIAISYAARKFGISRLQTVDEAKKKCPDLIAPHVATFKKGETTWKFHETPDVHNYKVSLDPFRRESRKIFQVFKLHCDWLEKGGTDEAFMDLSLLVHKKAIGYFPCLADGSPSDGQLLPPIPDRLPEDLKWRGILANSDDPEMPSDWDDIFIMIGSMIVQDIRTDVFCKLKYSCSAGIARNKILAKLGSAKNKPNGQTVIRTKAAIPFLCTCEFTDIWGLGGKLGDQVMKELAVPETGSMNYLLDIPIETLQMKLDPKVGLRVYNLARGNEQTEVVTRLNIKSMQSVKQFSKPLKTVDECKEWLKVFSADLAGRLMELDDAHGSPIRPKTVIIHQSQNKPRHVSHSKQGKFPRVEATVSFEAVSEELVDAGGVLLSQLRAEAGGDSIFPCSSLSLAISGIHDVHDPGIRPIDTYFTKTGRRISRNEKMTLECSGDSSAKLPDQTSSDEESLFVSQKMKCDQCHKRIDVESWEEHRDWHFAKQIQENDTKSNKPMRSADPTLKKSQITRQSPTKKKQKVDNNQSLLDFFKPKR